jgi:hypothetical protein
LLRNLKNAAATFGEGSNAEKSIRQTVEEHLLEMKAKGMTTNLARAREILAPTRPTARTPDSTTAISQTPRQLSFNNLALRPKPSAG